MQVESLGRYRIEKELGRGAMGRVFLAYDPQIDRRVAIKTIQIFAALPEAERLSARERFLREARSAGKLLHPGIVTIFDVGEADGVPYLAMEFIEGSTLESACGSLPWIWVTRCRLVRRAVLDIGLRSIDGFRSIDLSRAV